MAFTKQIIPNSIDSEGAASHQVSPGYVLTFIPWVNRIISPDSRGFSGVLDTGRVDPATPSNAMSIQDPLIVVNDAISITVNDNKSNPLKTVSIQLVSTDINYSAAIHPGDYVFVNLLDSEEKSRKIHAKVIARKPINGLHDGFKGYFKVQTVTRTMGVTPIGVKSYQYSINAVAFAELNSMILYNPAVQSAYNQKGQQGIFMLIVGEFFKDIAVTVRCDELIRLYIQILLGQSKRQQDPKIPQFGNTHFMVPPLVGSLLGLSASRYVNELYHVITGTWKDSSKTGTGSEPKNGFNPGIRKSTTGSLYSFETGLETQGVKHKIYENWDRKNIWSILNDTLNVQMNEIYTTFRISPNGSIMPTIIMRQKPFSTNNVKAEIPVTKYLNLPRWVLHPAMVMGYNFTTNDALRFNFVQTFVDTGIQGSLNTQITYPNFLEDTDDINRNGVRPYISTSRFGYLAAAGADGKPVGDPIASKKWNEVIADWVMNGHLKENGNINCVGIEEYIPSGDNLEFDNVVYHIEGVTHNWAISPSGIKSFRTNLSLSHGVTLQDNYPEMTQFTRSAKETEDFNRNKLMPGVAEDQDRRTNTGETYKLPADIKNLVKSLK